MQMGPTEPIVTCNRMDSLHRALELFSSTAGRGERLICVDEHRRVTGVVSLSDVFAFFSSSHQLVPHVPQGARLVAPPHPGESGSSQIMGRDAIDDSDMNAPASLGLPSQ
jgi:hypothetical protein